MMERNAFCHSLSEGQTISSELTDHEDPHFPFAKQPAVTIAVIFRRAVILTPAATYAKSTHPVSMASCEAALGPKFRPPKSVTSK